LGVTSGPGEKIVTICFVSIVLIPILAWYYLIYGLITIDSASTLRYSLVVRFRVFLNGHDVAEAAVGPHGHHIE